DGGDAGVYSPLEDGGADYGEPGEWRALRGSERQSGGEAARLRLGDWPGVPDCGRRARRDADFGATGEDRWQRYGFGESYVSCAVRDSSVGAQSGRAGKRPG